MKACFRPLAFALLALLGPASALAGEKFTLPSGRQAEILQVGFTKTNDGWSGYTLKYRTSLPLEPVAAVRKEADELWERYADAAGKSGYQNAVISAHQFEKGVILTYHKSHSFLFEKRDGVWRSSDFKDRESAKIEEQFLRDLIDRIDAAWASNAANALHLYMANDWTLAQSRPREGGDEGGAVTETLDLAAFLDRVRAAAGLSAKPDRKRQIVKISVAGDGRTAQAESLITETTTENGQPVASVRRVTDFFEARDRALIWTRSEAAAEK